MTKAHKDARFWNRIARKYAKDKIADEGGYARTLERTQGYLKTTDSALEIGCGTGTTALRLAAFTGTLIATDISAEMITIAEEKQARQEGGATPNLEFVCAAVEQLNYPDESFDVVMAFNALHMLRDLKDGLWRLRRMIKPGGLLISKTPCLGDMTPLFGAIIPVMQALGQAPTVATFTAAQLQTAIKAAGFELVVIERHASKGKDTRPFIVARRV